MSTIIKECLQCGVTFHAPLKEVNRGNGKFCSRHCSQQHKKVSMLKNNPPNCKCAQCGTDFYKKPSGFKNSKSGLYFCSRSCKDNAQMLEGIKEIHPSHYGKSLTGGHSNTYRRIAFLTQPKVCSLCGYDEHPEILEVHHIDRDRTNNTPENLVVLCKNCHGWEHYNSKDGQYHSLK